MALEEKHPVPIEDDAVFREYIINMELCPDCDPYTCRNFEKCVDWYDKHLVARPAYLLKEKTRRRYMETITDLQNGNLPLKVESAL